MQTAIPPDTFEHRARTGLPRLLALTVVDELVGPAQYLVALVRGIDVETGTTTYVVDRRQIPLLDALSRLGIVEALPKKGTLLDGKALQSRTVWIDVADDEAVAVAQTGSDKTVLSGIHAVAAGPHLVAAVTVAVEDTYLVELSTSGPLIVGAPCVTMMPVSSSATAPVVIPRVHIDMMKTTTLTVGTLHNERRMDTVEIGDTEMAFHSAIAEVHIGGPVVATIVVAAIGDPGILQLRVSQLLTGSTVDDRHIDRRVALRLRTVVDDAVIVGVGIIAAAHILSPCLVRLVPETGAVATAYDDLATAVTVDIPSHHHIVLSGTDIDIRPHVDRPQ